jgi:ribonuclease Y
MLNDFFSMDESLEQVKEKLSKENTKYSELCIRADAVQAKYDKQSSELEERDRKIEMLRNETEHSYKGLIGLLESELKTLEALIASKKEEIAERELKMAKKEEDIEKREKDVENEKKKVENYQNKLEKKEYNLNKFSEQLQKATKKLQDNK